MKSNLLDVFLFYNELDLLKARLEYLGEIVDYFIISEANVDFSGRIKDFVLSQELLNTLPYVDKIIYHREYLNLNSPSWVFKKFKYRNRQNRFLWKIQDAQRNSTLTPLGQFKHNDIIIFSDLDEFPSLSAIEHGQRRLELNKVLPSTLSAFSLEQMFFYYNLNNAAKHEKFYGSVMTTLGSFRKYLPHKYRSDKNNFEHIPSGGWHFSYFMNTAQILNKIQAISDVENISTYKSMTEIEIEKKIAFNSDLYDRNICFDKSEYKNIPSMLLAILKKYLPNCTAID